MIDLRVLRRDPDAVRRSQIARGDDASLVDEAIAADAQRRARIVEFDELRAQQRLLSKRSGQLRRAVESAESARGEADAKNALDAAQAIAVDLALRVRRAEEQQRLAEIEAQCALKSIGNLVDPRTPVGGENDYVVLDTAGTPRDFAAEGLEPSDHLTLGERLGAIDMVRGAKVSGSRFYYLSGAGAHLELALVNLAVAMASRNGLRLVIPPALVKPAAMEGTGFLGQAAENVYHLESDDLYLVGTAEVPLAAYHMDEVIDRAELPLRYVGYSPCYRREAGSHGRDTRGIFRVHWFDKVEMLSFCPAEEAEAEHLRLLTWQREFLDALELPYRVIDVASGDLGASASRKFDCEAWIPSQQRYRELTSASNCTQYQARRLRIRTATSTGNEPVATLNGTLCAVTRVIVALLENHQRADGSVLIPAALRSHLGGLDRLRPPS